MSFGYVFRQRMRYQFSITVPINHAKLEDKTLFLQITDETLLNFGKGMASNYLDQNWFSTSIGYRIHSDFITTIGYQNQFIIKGDAVHIEQNHLLIIAIIYNFDLRKSKA